jgi:hypothetical protein
MQKTAIAMCHMVKELGHPQPPTPMQTDNKTANDLLTNKIMPKALKAMGMQSHWLHVVKLRNNSDTTGDQAYGTWQIISPSIAQQVTTRPTDPLS